MLRDTDDIILGINGWNEQGHDAAACLLVNNVVTSFVEEERFTRKRYAYDTFPVHAILSCLQEQSLTPEQVTAIAIGWDMPLVYQSNGIEYPYSKQELLQLLFPAGFYGEESPAINSELHFISHHLAHAASAYRVSGFSEASILVLDGQGETSSGLLGKGENGEISIYETIPIQYSLGYFVETACRFLGLRSSDAGKLMGLAAQGKPIFDFPEFQLTESAYAVTNAPTELQKGIDQQKMMHTFWMDQFKARFPNHHPEKRRTFNRVLGRTKEELLLDEFSQNFAASVQKKLEDVVIHLTSVLTKKTGERKLVYAGGVALNCVANGRLISEDRVSDLYVQPAANDAGVSLGAALEVAYQKSGATFPEMNHCYLGPSFTNQEIESELRRLKVPYGHKTDITKVAAEAVNQGKVVAWFQGRMEVGPRALGSRSIIANPTLPQMHEEVNIIKSREQWRPLAPSILEDQMGDFFEHAHTNPFMLLSQKVKGDRQDGIPAVVHVDGSARFQSVSEETNPLYYQMISDFQELSGVPVVMNTSFNIEGEPIVMTPEQALRAF